MYGITFYTIISLSTVALAFIFASIFAVPKEVTNSNDFDAKAVEIIKYLGG